MPDDAHVEPSTRTPPDEGQHIGDGGLLVEQGNELITGRPVETASTSTSGARPRARFALHPRPGPTFTVRQKRCRLAGMRQMHG